MHNQWVKTTNWLIKSTESNEFEIQCGCNVEKYKKGKIHLATVYMPKYGKRSESLQKTPLTLGLFISDFRVKGNICYWEKRQAKHNN